MLVSSQSREGGSFGVRCDLPLAFFCGNVEVGQLSAWTRRAGEPYFFSVLL